MWEQDVTLESAATGKKCSGTDSLVYIAGGDTVLVNKASAGTVDGELTGAVGNKADCDSVIKGGTVYAVGSGTPETGIDANTGSRLYIQGGMGW